MSSVSTRAKAVRNSSAGSHAEQGSESCIHPGWTPFAIAPMLPAGFVVCQIVVVVTRFDQLGSRRDGLRGFIGGCFRASNEFDPVLKEKGREWRPGGLDELQRVLEAEERIAKSKTKSAAVNRVNCSPRKSRMLLRETVQNCVGWESITGLDACVQRIEAALYRASIPFLRSG